MPRSGREPEFFDSLLNRALVIISLTGLLILVHGYQAFRFDQAVQLPYLLMQRDPSLFPRDWYLQTDPQDKIRLFHLLLIRGLSSVIGLNTALFALLAASLACTFAAWMAIARRLFGSPLPGVIVAAMAVYFRFWELGANALVENIFIPRVEACALCYLAVALLLSRRVVLSGLLFAAAGFFQPAVPLQFAGVLALWILIAWDGPRFATFLKFAAAYWIISLPWMLYLRGTVTGTSDLSSAEIIRIFAYIRHPAHMVPFSWGRRWLMSALVGAWWLEVWFRRRKSDPGAAPLARLVFLAAGLLAVSVFFIEIVPVKWVVLFQPFRITMLLYLVVFMFLARDLADHFTSKNPAGPLRAALLIVALRGPQLLLPMVLFELTLNIAGRLERPIGARLQIVLAWLIGLGIAVAQPDLREEIGAAFLAGGIVMAINRRPSLPSTATLRAAFSALALLLFAALALFMNYPWQSKMLRGDGGRYNAYDRLLMKYQLQPIPIAAIERMAVWAKAHTSADALFVIPPARQDWGFRLFSDRSQVFDVKSIPYYPAGMEEWRNRYLAHRGVFDLNAVDANPGQRERYERAMSDWNADGIDADYDALSVDDMTRLVSRYGADYAIAYTLYHDPRLTEIHEEPAPEHKGASHRLYLYKVRKARGA